MYKFLICFSLSVFMFINTVFASDVEPKLMDGYSNDQEQSLGIICLNPGILQSSGNNRGLVDVLRRDDLNRVKEELRFIDVGNIKARLFNTSTATDFLNLIADDTVSVSLIYRTNFEFVSTDYTPDGNNWFNEMGKKWAEAGNPIDFRQNCGDSFVNSLEHRGLLYLAMQFRFNTYQDKQNFESRFSTSYGNLTNLISRLQTEIPVTIKGQVHFFAFQDGGDATKLWEIFEGDPTPANMCSLDKISSCIPLMNHAVKYATDINVGFPSQFKAPNDHTPPPLAAVSEIDNASYEPYLDFKIPSEVTPVITAARNQLGDLMLQISPQIQRINFITTLIAFPFVYDVYRAKLTATLSDLNANLLTLKIAGASCFTNIKDCLAERDQALARLKPIDPTVFQLPDRFDVTETNAQSETKQLWVAVNQSDTNQIYRGTKLQPTVGGEYDISIRFVGAIIYMTKYTALGSGGTQQKIADYRGTDMRGGEYRGEVTYMNGTKGTFTAHLTESE